MVTIGSLVILALDLYVIFQILGSASPATTKLLWILLVLFLPVIGAILYLLMGRGASTV